MELERNYYRTVVGRPASRIDYVCNLICFVLGLIGAGCAVVFVKLGGIQAVQKLIEPDVDQKVALHEDENSKTAEDATELNSQYEIKSPAKKGNLDSSIKPVNFEKEEAPAELVFPEDVDKPSRKLEVKTTALTNSTLLADADFNYLVKEVHVKINSSNTIKYEIKNKETVVPNNNSQEIVFLCERLDKIIFDGDEASQVSGILKSNNMNVDVKIEQVENTYLALITLTNKDKKPFAPGKYVISDKAKEEENKTIVIIPDSATSGKYVSSVSKIKNNLHGNFESPTAAKKIFGGYNIFQVNFGSPNDGYYELVLVKENIAVNKKKVESYNYIPDIHEMSLDLSFLGNYDLYLIHYSADGKSFAYTNSPEKLSLLPNDDGKAIQFADFLPDSVKINNLELKEYNSQRFFKPNSGKDKINIIYNYTGTGGIEGLYFANVVSDGKVQAFQSPNSIVVNTNNASQSIDIKNEGPYTVIGQLVQGNKVLKSSPEIIINAISHPPKYELDAEDVVLKGGKVLKLKFPINHPIDISTFQPANAKVIFTDKVKNYAINFVSATYDTSSNTVTLTLERNPPFGEYEFSVKGATDLVGNIIDETNSPRKISVFPSNPAPTSAQPASIATLPVYVERGISSANQAPHIEYQEYTKTREYKTGFNPSDKVVTAVARLYYLA